MKSFAFGCVALLALFTSLLVSTCVAEIYKYTDKEGRTHYVGSLESVPQEFKLQIQNQKPLPPISRVPAHKYSAEIEAGTTRTTSKVEVFVTEWCGYCKKLESFLQARNIPFVRFDVEQSAKGKKIYESLGGGSIPITRIGTQVIRGFDPPEILRALGASGFKGNES